jgi:hypothetical protein
MPAQILPSGTYTLAVNASAGVPGAPIPSHLRSATAAVTITVVAGAPPSVSVAAAVVRVNPGQGRVVLAGAVDKQGHAQVALQWTTGDLSDKALDAVVSLGNVGAVCCGVVLCALYCVFLCVFVCCVCCVYCVCCV